MIAPYLNTLCASLEIQALHPQVADFRETYSAPLDDSPEEIVRNIVALGYETRTVRTVYSYNYPDGLPCDLKSAREDWQVTLGSDGFFRIRPDESGTVWMSFFHVLPEKQGQGRGRFWFPRAVQLLFLAGAKRIIGQANARTRFPSSVPLRTERLRDFYKSYGFTEFGDGWLELRRDTFFRLREELEPYRAIS